jgi:serine protease Do
VVQTLALTTRASPTDDSLSPGDTVNQIVRYQAEQPLALKRRAIAGTAIALAVAGLLLATGIVPSPGANAQPVNIQQPVQLPTFADVVQAVSPSVVAIRVEGESMRTINIPGLEDVPLGSPEGRFGPNQTPVPTTSLGSGFFISADGYIVTNNHVIDGARQMTVILNDGTEYPATLIGHDELTDLALVKVNADRQFTYVKFAETPVRVGDWALAVGNPFGFGGTVTLGIVSGRERQLSNNTYDEYIQIDAAVNQGNSGGPSFNLAGEVIGVNTAIISPSGGNVGLAFAVPADLAASVIAQLRDEGTVHRGWLGVGIQTIDDRMAAALGRDHAGGVIVSDPFAGDPAAAAGVKNRDIVIAINGVAVDNTIDLARRIADFAPGTEITLTIVRDGDQMELPVTLGERPVAQQVAAVTEGATEPPTEYGLGLTVGVNRQNEVTVMGMNPVATAAAAGLREGDVILSIDDAAIGVYDDLQAAVAAARDAGHKVMLFQIRRGDTLLYIPVDTWMYD